MPEFAFSTSTILSKVEKLDQLLAPGFRRVELGFFREEDLADLERFLSQHGLAFGAHAPFPYRFPHIHPFPSGPDRQKRRDTLDTIARSAKATKAFGGEYLVVHLTTAIYGDSGPTTRRETVQLVEASAAELAEISRVNDLPIFVENIYPNPYFYRAEDFTAIFKAYPRLRLCLDLGHLHLTARNEGLDMMDFVARLLPYVGNVHIYNTTPELYPRLRHIPIHPRQREEEGYGDFAGVLSLIARNRPDCLYVFEHMPFYPADSTFVYEGIDYVRCLVEQADE